MKKDAKVTAQNIMDLLGQDNIVSYTNCMTRLRVTLKDSSLVDEDKVKNLPNIMGLITKGNQYQIILGPGFVNRVVTEFEKLSSVKREAPIGEDDDKVKDLAKVATETKNQYRKQNAFMDFLSKISQIFSPFVAAFIAAGLLQATGSIILVIANNNPNDITKSWISFFTTSLSVLTQILCVIIGWNTAKIYGGTPIIGALLGAMYTPAFGTIIGGMFVPDAAGSLSGTFLGIPVGNVNANWFTVGIFKDGKAAGLNGSIFGALIVALLAAVLEKNFNKVIPDGAKIFLVPLLTVISMFILQIIIIIPLSGYLFIGLSWFFGLVTGNKWVMPFMGIILAGIWLWAVVFGIHQGATPIYLLLIQNTGINPLFPILAMAGASQVGAALALYARAEKGGVLRKQIQGTIIPGFFGIGEPLIYGVTLPRMKPFITACIGATFGGLFIGLMPLFGLTVGTTALGPSGLLATPMISSTTGPVWAAMLVYLLANILTYGTGFVFTYFFGYKGVDLK